MVTRDRVHFLLLNIGHFLDHLFMLVFATVAALALSKEWGVSYADLLKFATPGFIAFGLFSLPSGWLGDKWSRDGMMVVFFIGAGLSSIATSFASTPFEVGIGLFVIGVFAAIYHPVGLAIVSLKWKNTGIRLAANGVWGNAGVGGATLITGYMIDNSGWRMAFFVPGIFAIFCGLVYLWLQKDSIFNSKLAETKERSNKSLSLPETLTGDGYKSLLMRIFGIVLITTILNSIVFQSTTFALPKIFDERLQSFAKNTLTTFNLEQLPGQADIATMIGILAFIVFTVASFGQLAVGYFLDKYGPRMVFLSLASLQVVCYGVMPGLTDGPAFWVSLGFMIGAFGLIPINDFILSKIVTDTYRARVYGARFVVGFTVLAATLPFLSLVYDMAGFDLLFYILALASLMTAFAVLFLPKGIHTKAFSTS